MITQLHASSAMNEVVKGHENLEISKIRGYLVTIKELPEAKEEMRRAIIVKIKNGVFSVAPDSNVSQYVNENGRTILRPEALAENRFFSETSNLAGYKEIKTSAGIYELYRLTDIQDGLPKPGKKPVDKFSEEYFEFWKGQIILRDRSVIEAMIPKNKEGGYAKLEEKFFKHATNYGALTLNDFLMLSAHKQITPEQYKKHLPKITAALPWQLQDANGLFSLWEYRRFLHFVASLVEEKKIAPEKAESLKIEAKKHGLRKCFEKGLFGELLDSTELEIMEVIPRTIDQIRSLKEQGILSDKIAQECEKIIQQKQQTERKISQSKANLSAQTSAHMANLSQEVQMMNANPVINLTYRTKYQTDKILSA